MDATPERVWGLWTTAGGIEQWWAPEGFATEVQGPDRLAHASLIDFVPDHEPYEQWTVVELHEDAEGTRVEMTAGALHDEVWSERLVAGRTNELDNLARLVQTTSADPD